MGFERFWHKSYVSGVPGEADIEKITMPEVLERNARRFPSVFTLNFLGKKSPLKSLMLWLTDLPTRSSISA